jgi:hypothetical protein
VIGNQLSVISDRFRVSGVRSEMGISVLTPET